MKKSVFAAVCCLMLLCGCAGGSSSVSSSVESQSALQSSAQSTASQTADSEDVSSGASVPMTEAQLVAAYGNISGCKCVWLYYWEDNGTVLCGILPGADNFTNIDSDIQSLYSRPIKLSQLPTVLGTVRELVEVYVMPADGNAVAQTEQYIRQLVSVPGVSYYLTTAITGDAAGDVLSKQTADVQLVTTEDWNDFGYTEDDIAVDISLPADWKRDSKYSTTFSSLQSDIKIFEFMYAVKLKNSWELFTDSQGNIALPKDEDGKNLTVDYYFASAFDSAPAFAYTTEAIYNPGGEKQIDVWYCTTCWVSKTYAANNTAVCVAFFTLTPPQENAQGMQLYARILSTLRLQ